MNANASPPPLDRLLVRVEKQIDSRGSLDRPSAIFNPTHSIPRNIHDGSKRIEMRIGCNRSLLSLRARCGDPNTFRLSLKRSRRIDRTERRNQASSPSATFSAVAITCRLDNHRVPLRPDRRTNFDAAGKKNQHRAQDAKLYRCCFFHRISPFQRTASRQTSSVNVASLLNSVIVLTSASHRDCGSLLEHSWSRV